MEKVLEHPWVKEYKEDLHEIRQLDIIEEKLGVDRLYVVTGVIAVLFLGMLGVFGGSPVANLVGFIYPTYKSYKALKSENKKDDTQWLTYWVVYSFFIVVESFTDVLMSWIPMYYLAKIGFLYFCMSPTFEGSTIIFKKFIEPFLDSTSARLDQAEDIVEDLKDEITEKGTAFVVNKVVTNAAKQAVGGGASASSTPEPGSEGSDDEIDYRTSTNQNPPTLSDSEDNYHPKST